MLTRLYVYFHHLHGYHVDRVLLFPYPLDEPTYADVVLRYCTGERCNEQLQGLCSLLAEIKN